MKNLSYPVCVFLALVINILIFFVISIDDARVSFLSGCIAGCEDWYTYASSHIFTTSGIFVSALFATPLLAVALAFRSVPLQKILLVLFLLIFLYNLVHLASIWNKSFDIHGDEVGAIDLLVSIGIGVLSVFFSVLSTVIDILLGRRKTKKERTERSVLENGIFKK